ncbi:MAG: hypothetical protein ACRD3W_09180, partial [Terriglobales bacterium]
RQYRAEENARPQFECWKRWDELVLQAFGAEHIEHAENCRRLGMTYFVRAQMSTARPLLIEAQHLVRHQSTAARSYHAAALAAGIRISKALLRKVSTHVKRKRPQRSIAGNRTLTFLHRG